MGYMRHHAIVVTSWKTALLNEAWLRAKELGMSVTNITDEVTNGYRSFLIAPDGSKEGWDTSDKGDTNRNRIIEWLDAQRYEDGSTSIGWVEVQFADDDADTRIVRDSDHHYRERWANS